MRPPRFRGGRSNRKWSTRRRCARKRVQDVVVERGEKKTSASGDVNSVGQRKVGWASRDPGSWDTWQSTRPVVAVASLDTCPWTSTRTLQTSELHARARGHACTMRSVQPASRRKNAGERDLRQLQHLRTRDRKRATGTSIYRWYLPSRCMTHTRWSHTWRGSFFNLSLAALCFMHARRHRCCFRFVAVDQSRPTPLCHATRTSLLPGCVSACSVSLRWRPGSTPPLPTSILHRPMRWGWIEPPCRPWILPGDDAAAGLSTVRSASATHVTPPSLDPTAHPPFWHVAVPRARALRSRSSTRSRSASRSVPRLHRDLGGGRTWPCMLRQFATGARVRHAPDRAASHICCERSFAGLQKRARAMADNHGVAREVARPRPFPFEGYPPGPRCGHTLTTLAGSTSADTTLVLFGGATALDGLPTRMYGAVSPGSPTPRQARGGSSSHGGARLSGATDVVHAFEVASGAWSKLECTGDKPTPRAAHAAVAVGKMMVVFGGIGPDGLASGELCVLDFTTNSNQPKWHKVEVQGDSPGPRYAHSMSLVAHRFLVVIGGNNGKQVMGDVWALDTADKPYRWTKIEPTGACPPPIMYASTCSRSDGLLLLHGGRDASNRPLSGTFGLVRHRDGRWEWAEAPGQALTPRYQNTCAFTGSRLYVTGGTLGSGRMVDESLSVAVLDTAMGAWLLPEETPEQHSRRCRHAACSVGDYVFMYGGLRGTALLDDMLVAKGTESVNSDDIDALEVAPWRNWRKLAKRQIPLDEGSTVLLEASKQEAMAALNVNAARDAMGVQYAGDQGDHAEGFDPTLHAGVAPRTEAALQRNQLHRFMAREGLNPRNLSSQNVTLYHRAVVVHSDAKSDGLMHQLSIDRFENEGKRMSFGSAEKRSPLLQQSTSQRGLHKVVIRELLRPRDWAPTMDHRFFLREAEIAQLCDQVIERFKDESSLLKLHAPMKIFGDLHGQFGDLMRLFSEYGSPSTTGDITYIDYLFLGDYVDRGMHSLETICLLLALKIEHPNNVHLIRGNHEAVDINALFGFRDECLRRMGEESGHRSWLKINEVFNWMPLAATIEDKILCMHGGIGRSILDVQQIADLKRPLTMEEGGVVLMDLLWSDPTLNDGVEGLQPSPRGPGLVTFGPDRVRDFCQQNNIQMIVRAHECVMDGFERFAQGHLITLFSATNYCGTANNAGAILVLGRDLTLVPKLIHPLPPTQVSVPVQDVVDVEDGLVSSQDAGVQLGGVRPTNDTWMQELNEQRPPTPPRGRGPPGASPVTFA